MHFVKCILTRVPDECPKTFARLLDETTETDIYWNDRYPTLNTLTHVHNYDITSFSNCKAPGLPGVLLEEFIFYIRWVKVEEAVPNSSLVPESTRISPTKDPFPCHRVCCKNHLCRPGRWKLAGSSQLGEWLEDLKGPSARALLLEIMQYLPVIM